jgi:hypothetical protein
MARALNPVVKEDPVASDFEDGRLALLLDYWNRARGTAELPAVSAIDPAEFKFLLGWLMIMEPLDGGADYRYRLYGTHVAEAFGRDLTGERVGNSFPEVAQFVIGAYQRLLQIRRPILTVHTPPALIPIDRWERLILPFADEVGAIVRILVGTIAHGRRKGERKRVPWPLDTHNRDAVEGAAEPAAEHPKMQR